MSKRERVIPSLKELKADMQGMTFAQKADHLWTYYKEWLIVLLLIVVLISVTVTSIQNLSKNIVCSATYANISITPGGMRHMSEEFAKDLGVDNVKDVVEVNYTNFQSLVDPTSSEDHYNAAMLMVNMVAAGRMDYALMDKLAMEFYITQDIFLDLREFFTEEEIRQLDENRLLIWYQPGELDAEGNIIPESLIEEERYPVAVRVQNTPFCQKEMYGADVYFAVGGREPKLDMVRKAWERMNTYQ